MKWLLLLFPLPLLALSVENPCAPSLYETKMIWCPQDECCPCEFTMRAGFTGDYIFNRQLRVNQSDNHSDIRTVEIYTNSGYVDFNMWDQFDVFALFGVSTISLETAASAFRPNPSTINVVVNDTVTLRMASNWSWGVGARASIWEWCNFCFGLEGAYFFTNPNLQSASSDRISMNTTYLKGVSFKYHEWLLALGTTYRFVLDETWDVLPYFSMIWNPARVTMDDAQAVFTNGLTSYTLTLSNLAEQRSWGYALGMTLLAIEGFSMNIEGRFINERAFSFNTQILF